MKFVSKLFPSALQVFSGVLLASSSFAEDAKIFFADGVKIDVTISRPSRTAGGDFDDKTQFIKARIKMSNSTSQQDYNDYTAVFIALGQSTVDRKITKVLLREEFPLSLAARKMFERETENIETMFDTTGAKFGHKYDGWILQVTDPNGEIVYTQSTSSTFEKLPKEIQAMKENASYDKKLKLVSNPSLMLRR